MTGMLSTIRALKNARRTRRLVALWGVIAMASLWAGALRAMADDCYRDVLRARD